MKKNKAIIILLVIFCLILTGILIIRSNPESVTGNPRTESYVNAVLYQKSAEVTAQYVQAFELARIKLDDAIEKNGGTGKGLCIVTDIDATLMDDSAYLATVIMSNDKRKKIGLSPWNNKDWLGYYTSIATEAMKPVAGAQKFIEYARAKECRIYFITNRPYYELDLTVKQLKKYGFIDDDIYNKYSGLDNLQEYHSYDDVDGLNTFKNKVEDDGHFEIGKGFFTLKDDYTIQVQGLDFSSDKAERRHNVANSIGNNDKIVLYLGDSINDMVSKNEYEYTELSKDICTSFSGKNGNFERNRVTMNELWNDKWGTEFIVMPNSAYGDWIKATWNREKITDLEEINAIKKELSNYSYYNFETWYNGPSPISNLID